MKYILVGCALFCGSMSVNSAVVSQGDTLVGTFNDLSLVAQGVIAISPKVTFNFGAQDPFSIGDEILVEYFDDIHSPVASRTVTIGSPTNDVYALDGDTLPSVMGNIGIIDWSDLNGAIKVSVLNGSIDLLNAQITVYTNSNQYSGAIGFTPVPLPAAGFLFPVGLLALLGLKSRSAEKH